MEESGLIECGQVLDITSIDTWYKAAVEVLAKDEPLTIRSEELQRIDAAGLQALTAIYQAAKEKNLNVTWQAPAAVLVDSATLLGLHETLELPA